MVQRACSPISSARARMFLYLPPIPTDLRSSNLNRFSRTLHEQPRTRPHKLLRQHVRAKNLRASENSGEVERTP